MKILTLIVGLCVVSITSAQNCSSADYSNLTAIITALNSSLNVTNGLINLIPNVSLYSNYYEYWININYYNNLNVFGNNFASMANNVTTALLDIFKKFSSASSNTSINSNQSLLELQAFITLTNITIIPLSMSENSIATQLTNDINMQLMNLYVFIERMLNNVDQLYIIGQPSTSANILKIIPSTAIVQGLLKNLQNVTNVFVKYINTSATNLKYLHSVFKKSDPTIIAWDLMKNQTVYNWTLAANNSESSINSTISNFVKQANAMYNGFVAKIPTALKANIRFQNDLSQGESFLSQFNNSFLQLKDELTNLFSMVRSQIMQYDDKFVFNMISRITNTFVEMFYNYQKNATTLNCTITLMNTSEALWKAFGGPTNFFNCSNYENMMLPKLQPFLQAYLNTIMQDINATMAAFQNCLSVKNLTDDYQSSSLPFSMQKCFQQIGMSLMDLSSIDTSSLTTILTQMLSNGDRRIDACFSSTEYRIYSTFISAQDSYYKCIEQA